MIGRITLVLGFLLLAWTLSSCGTIEVDLADERDANATQLAGDGGPAEQAVQPPATSQVAETPQVTLAATLPALEETPESVVTPAAASQDGPAGWLRFYDGDYGIELWHPEGTTVELGQPSRPVFSSVEFPDGIVEEQLFVVRVMQDEGGAFGPGSPQAILEIKLVANSEEKRAAEMAELFSKRCPGPASDSLQPSTINVQLSGFRYSCEGMDGIIFNDFWAPLPADPGLLFGATWADMSSPLADDILATVAFAG
jgi:hypothetical protein